MSELGKKASPLDKAGVKERSVARKEEGPLVSGEAHPVVVHDATVAMGKDRDGAVPPPLPVPIITFNI